MKPCEQILAQRVSQIGIYKLRIAVESGRTRPGTSVCTLSCW
jgi:hypothetical protein